jgi:hypothetical protein
MSDSVDLWGTDFEADDILPPITIMKEQAALLGRKTKFVVVADIETENVGKEIVHHFSLIARALDNYKYFLFRLKHEIDIYPVTVYWPPRSYEAKDEEEFTKLLGEILSSENTTKIIRSMLAQSKAAG